MFTSFGILPAIHSKILLRKPFHYSSRGAQKCSKKAVIKGPPWRVLFFGTDEFSLQSLKALCAKWRTGTLISSLGVVTKKHSNVCKFSTDEKIALHYWPVNASVIQSNYDIGMVVSFGNLITKAVIDALPLGCINVHASILPRWRGAAPIIHAILAGDNETGVTIMRIHPHKFDVGEIVRQYRVPISLDETAVELEKRLSLCGAQLLMECVRDLPKCVQMAVPQPQEGVTYAPKVDQNLSLVDWSKTTGQGVYNMHRALSHLYPLRTDWHGQMIKLRDITLDAEIGKNTSNQLSEQDSYKSALDFLNSSSEKNLIGDKIVKACSDAGLCSYDKATKLMKVLCADGQKIIVNKLQVGNKIMSGADFYNGFMTKILKSEWIFSKIKSINESN